MMTPLDIIFLLKISMTNVNPDQLQRLNSNRMSKELVVTRACLPACLRACSNNTHTVIQLSHLTGPLGINIIFIIIRSKVCFCRRRLTITCTCNNVWSCTEIFNTTLCMHVSKDQKRGTYSLTYLLNRRSMSCHHKLFTPTANVITITLAMVFKGQC